MYRHLEISMAISQKFGNQSTSRLSDTTPQQHPNDNDTTRTNCSAMFIAALFIITRTYKQLPRCPSIEEQIKM